MDKEWWADNKYDIGDIEYAETHVTSVRARQDEHGQWEYAIVRYRYQMPTLLYTIRGGELVESDNDA